MIVLLSVSCLSYYTLPDHSKIYGFFSSILSVLVVVYKTPFHVFGCYGHCYSWLCSLDLVIIIVKFYFLSWLLYLVFLILLGDCVSMLFCTSCACSFCALGVSGSPSMHDKDTLYIICHRLSFRIITHSSYQSFCQPMSSCNSWS